MITEHTHSENNDWQEPGEGQLSVSAAATPRPAIDALVPENGSTTEEGPRAEKLPEASKEEVVVASEGVQEASVVESGVNMASSEKATHLEVPTKVDAPLGEANVAEEVVTTPADIRQPNLLEADDAALFPLEVESPLSLEEAVRPFTDFIEEFRQNEAQFGSLLNEPDSAFATFVADGASLHAPTAFVEIVLDDLGPAIEVPSSDAGVPAPESATSSEVASVPSSQVEETLPGLAQPRLSPERPVSPLLRPATRPRLPRHGRHRIDELIHPAELRGDMLKAPVHNTPAEELASVAEAPAIEESKPEEQPARPARRYRFDRPSTTVSATPATSKVAAPASGNEAKVKRDFAAARTESVTSTEPVPAHASSALELPASRSSIQETTPAIVESVPVAPLVPPPATERRRRGSHSTREKEQPIVVVPEPVAPVVEPVPAVVEEVPLEDLPPLEYSELQAANSRRRRRRRAGTASTTASTSVVPATNGAIAPKGLLSEMVVAPPPIAPAAPSSMPLAPKGVPTLPPASYNIVSGYTVSQMNQGNDVSGPFMGPEPSPARGSNFTPAPIRHARNEALRNVPGPGKSSESPTLSVASINHMANVVSQAMQTQTDRMVAELRRANQVPTNVSVTLPPFPSTERVGVFVDVANLLYSARTLRITVDFGKLLDFLRGNRRLVRAQAYCPTSPQPGDDQMFLQAVKGLGYRITTKNYKTFSSGAKKADLDLDLCMDVVRLVDGKAVDCVVLVSGDSDFMPMLDYCSDHGVRVEVAAFDESMSATLRQSCDLFVNLSMLEEIRL
ncbi:MAG TPA: NYN domain-containing protein [Ktedonobacteraceae bacterium]